MASLFPPRGRAPTLLVLAVATWLVVAALAGAAGTEAVGAGSPSRSHVAGDSAMNVADVADAVRSACRSPNPYVATTLYVDDRSDPDAASRSAAVALRDTMADDRGDEVPLATYPDLGAVYGLAYDAGAGQLYAAAFLKRGVLFPPGGPGSIRRLDLASGSVETWASIAAGSASLHRLTHDEDAAVVPWIGRAGLGDIDLAEDGSTLFVANLFDGRIYSLASSDGSVVADWPNGAAGEAWGADARPFGLAAHGDRVYHGVVDASGASLGITVPVGHIYETGHDGRDTRLVASFPLDPEHAAPDHIGWGPSDVPVISDIEFLASDDLVVSIRNLAVDRAISELPLRLGDTLPGHRSPGGWTVVVEPKLYDDTLMGYDDSLTGGLAVLPGMDLVVSSGHGGVAGTVDEAVVWLDPSSGRQIRYEPVALGGAGGSAPPLAGPGDVEVLCAKDVPLDAAAVATATAAAAAARTGTAVAAQTAAVEKETAAAATSEALEPTLTAQAPTQAVLATAAARKTVAPAQATKVAQNSEAIASSCSSDDPYFVVANQSRRTGSTQHVKPSDSTLIAFSKGGALLQLARFTDTGSVYGVAYDAKRQQLYAGSINHGHLGNDLKSRPKMGPGGPGAIYRLDLTTGAVVSWAMLPARSLVETGRFAQSGLGDIEFDAPSDTLFAVSLEDRLIYRLSVPGGELLGAIPHGAVSESWGDDGYPFALAVRDGKLYHAVVPDYSARLRFRDAIVYRSELDGSTMSEVARIELNYRMAGQSANHGSAFVSDLEFGESGDLVVSLRDGALSTSGDLLFGALQGRSWSFSLEREHFADRTTRDEAIAGGVARVPELDTVVSAASLISSPLKMGAVWNDVRSGVMTSRRPVLAGSRQSYAHWSAKGPVFGYIESLDSLGDVEALCVPASPTPTVTSTATPTPMPTATSTPTPSVTSSATATNTSSPTPTPTPVPSPLYLPVTLRERCSPEKRRSDVVLVIDASTSMLQTTRAGRTKLAAAVEAAREFLNQLRLGDGDQAAVVAFNAEARLLQPLTASRADLSAALAAIETAQKTRIHLGVAEARVELASERHQEDNAPVLIVLTDGRSNPDPASLAVEEARRAKAEGVIVFAIGLGADLDEEALREMPSTPGGYFHAPSAEDLAAIYRQIAVEIPCPASSFWGRR